MRIEFARFVRFLTLACTLQSSYAEADDGPTPTYSRDVAPILRDRCQSCHQSGQVGPFPLVSYDHARKRAGDLAAVVRDHRMPPWKPEHGFGPKLQQDRSLSAAEIGTVTRWADAGAPRGEDCQEPPARPAVAGWALGKPDLVLEPTESYTVPATGPDLYRCFVIPTNLPDDVYVSAIEYQPGNRRVVHHLMSFVETAGAGRARDVADPGPGYETYANAGVEISGDLGGWAPGNEPTHLPEGVGRLLPRRADVILLIHYHPVGKPEVDRTKIGLHFARKPIRQTLQWKGVASQDFRLPPGESDVAVKAKWFLPVDVELLGIAPHMHQLGRDMTVTATLPDNRVLNLLHIADWDPDWQATYNFETPVRLPRGSTVHVVGRYDNSKRPGNPNQPPKLVKYGHSSVDEMCVAYLAVVKAGQDLTRPGERDDLFEIFVDQHRRGLKRELISRRRR